MIRPTLPMSFPQAMEESSGLVKKHVPVSTLRQLAKHCTCAMKPYHRHPRLMPLLLRLLHGGDQR